MIQRRILIEKRRKVKATGAMEAFVTVDGSNLRSDPAHHEVFEDSRHFGLSFQRFVNGGIEGNAISSIFSPFLLTLKPEEKGVL